jgi:hypothetical protein
VYRPCSYMSVVVALQRAVPLPGALTQAAFSFDPTPSLSTTFSGSSPPTSVTATKLELLALPVLLAIFGLDAGLLMLDAVARSTELDDSDREMDDLGSWVCAG